MLPSSLRFKKAPRDGEEGRDQTKTRPGVMHLPKEPSSLEVLRVLALGRFAQRLMWLSDNRTSASVSFVMEAATGR